MFNGYGTSLMVQQWSFNCKRKSSRIILVLIKQVYKQAKLQITTILAVPSVDREV